MLQYNIRKRHKPKYSCISSPLKPILGKNHQLPNLKENKSRRKDTIDQKLK